MHNFIAKRLFRPKNRRYKSLKRCVRSATYRIYCRMVDCLQSIINMEYANLHCVKESSNLERSSTYKSSKIQDEAKQLLYDYVYIKEKLLTTSSNSLTHYQWYLIYKHTCRCFQQVVRIVYWFLGNQVIRENFSIKKRKPHNHIPQLLEQCTCIAESFEGIYTKKQILYFKCYGTFKTWKKIANFPHL